MELREKQRRGKGRRGDRQSRVFKGGWDRGGRKGEEKRKREEQWTWENGWRNNKLENGDAKMELVE